MYVSCVLSAYNSIYLQTSFAWVTKIYPSTPVTIKPSRTRSTAQMPAENIEVATDTVTTPTVQEQWCGHHGYYRRQRWRVIVGGQRSDRERQQFELGCDDVCGEICFFPGRKSCRCCWGVIIVALKCEKVRILHVTVLFPVDFECTSAMVNVLSGG